MHIIAPRDADSAERQRLRRLGITKFRGVRLVSTGAYYPTKEVTNGEISQLLAEDGGGYAGVGAEQIGANTSPADIEALLRDRIGTDRRRVAAEDELCEEMMGIAGRRAIENAGLKPADIDWIGACANPPTYNAPGAHNYVADEIGLRRGHAGSSINVACSGVLDAMEIACHRLTAGNDDYCLVVGGNGMGPVQQQRLGFARGSDRGIFGDGAAGVLLIRDQGFDGEVVFQRRDDSENWWRIIHPFRGETPVIKLAQRHRDEILRTSGGKRTGDDWVAAVKKGFHMEGNREWFNHWVRTGFGPHMMEFMKEVGMTSDGVNVDHPPDLYLMHQPNWGLYEGTLEWTTLIRHRERALEVYKTGADLISAELGIALDEAIRSERLKAGDSFYAGVYGAGFTQVNAWFEKLL